MNWCPSGAMINCFLPQSKANSLIVEVHGKIKFLIDRFTSANAITQCATSPSHCSWSARCWWPLDSRLTTATTNTPTTNQPSQSILNQLTSSREWNNNKVPMLGLLGHGTIPKDRLLRHRPVTTITRPKRLLATPSRTFLEKLVDNQRFWILSDKITCLSDWMGFRAKCLPRRRVRFRNGCPYSATSPTSNAPPSCLSPGSWALELGSFSPSSFGTFRYPSVNRIENISVVKDNLGI